MTPREMQRLDAIERRLDELAAQVARLSQGSAPAPAPPAPKPAPTGSGGRSMRFETAVGLTWISRIAVVTVVLALAFFFEYAFENHWIGESGRVLLGAGCGAVALAAGERLWRAGQGAYAQALTAAGIAFVFLSIWAGFALYHLLPQGLAFAALFLATGAAGALAARYDSAAVALLGLAGGFATPLLLATAGNAWFVLGYALILDAGAVGASRLRPWRWLEPLALAGTTVLYASQPAAHGNILFVLAYGSLFAASADAAVVAAALVLASAATASAWAPGMTGLALCWALAAGGLAVADWRGWPSAVTASLAGFWLAYGIWYGSSGSLALLPPLTAAFLLFLSWPVWRARRNLPLRFQDLLLLALNAGLFVAASDSLLRGVYGGFEGLFALSVAAAHAAVARVLRQRDRRGALLAAGVASVLLVLAAPLQFTGYRITFVWALEGAALVWIGTRFTGISAATQPAVRFAGAIFLLVVLRLMLVDAGMYPNPASYNALANARFLTFAVAAASLWASAWWIRQGRAALAAYAAGHAVMLGGLCLEILGGAARGAAAANFRSVASMSLSVMGGVYAVLLVAGGAAARNTATRMLGVGLIGIVVVKLYLYDVWLLGQFYRMAAFAILGVLLLAVSYVYSRRHTAD